MGQNVHTDILFLESQLQEQNDQLTSQDLTAEEREQIQLRIQLLVRILDYFRLNHADSLPKPPSRKPPASEHPAQDTATESHKRP